MTNQKIRAIGAGVLVTVWAALTFCCWFLPARQFSDAERRELEQFPELSGQTLLSADFMSKFEGYTLDQFPLRDSFRQIKSLFHYYALQQMDNNDIYIADGYAAKMEYPLQQNKFDRAMRQYNLFYNTYLKDSDCKVYTTVIPDKGYYLAPQTGHLQMDYQKVFSTVEGLSWATYVDITDCLEISDYYRTDTHWRQEAIVPVAQKLCEAMGVQIPQEGDFTPTAVEKPFYGVYYGQAALPMNAETMYLMESEILNEAVVYNYLTWDATEVYDENMLQSKDLYDVFLSGPQPLLIIDNPNATTDKELVIIRDSFGSSLSPLLLHSYAKVTLVDIRYIGIPTLKNYLSFTDQDVLFAHSTLVLNMGISQSGN